MLLVIRVGANNLRSSRTLTALAQQGYAPKIFAYIDRSGRPLVSVCTVLAFGAIAYVQMAPDGSTVFGWLLAMSSLAALLTWGSICVVSRPAYQHESR